MQWPSAIIAILALAAAAYSAGQIQQAEHVADRVHDLEKRLLKIEALAARISMDERLFEVEKWVRGRCVGIPVKQVCEEMLIIERLKD